MIERFKQIYTEHITRPGADKLLAWLESSDFFTAPASTRYHLCRPGGLVEHSLHVYERLKSLYWNEYEGFFPADEIITPVQEESIAICGLLHDVCKANFYAIEMRNKKNEQGVWEQVPFYTVKDQLPYGHGEKSVYIISSFIRLTRDEAMAIRWHRGGFDDSVKGGCYAMGEAYNRHPLAVLTHIADLMATHLDEVEES